MTCLPLTVTCSTNTIHYITLHYIIPHEILRNVLQFYKWNWIFFLSFPGFVFFAVRRQAGGERMENVFPADILNLMCLQGCPGGAYIALKLYLKFIYPSVADQRRKKTIERAKKEKQKGELKTLKNAYIFKIFHIPQSWHADTFLFKSPTSWLVLTLYLGYAVPYRPLFEFLIDGMSRFPCLYLHFATGWSERRKRKKSTLMVGAEQWNAFPIISTANVCPSINRKAISLKDHPWNFAQLLLQCRVVVVRRRRSVIRLEKKEEKLHPILKLNAQTINHKQRWWKISRV